MLGDLGRSPPSEQRPPGLGGGGQVRFERSRARDRGPQVWEKPSSASASDIPSAGRAPLASVSPPRRASLSSVLCFETLKGDSTARPRSRKVRESPAKCGALESAVCSPVLMTTMRQGFRQDGWAPQPGQGQQVPRPQSLCPRAPPWPALPRLPPLPLTPAPGHAGWAAPVCTAAG